MTPGKVVPASKRKSYKRKIASLFCANVQKKRLELNMTQETLANMVNATTPWVSQMEAGRFPRDETRIIALARALGVSLDALFGFEKEEQQ